MQNIIFHEQVTSSISQYGLAAAADSVISRVATLNLDDTEPANKIANGVRLARISLNRDRELKIAFAQEGANCLFFHACISLKKKCFVPPGAKLDAQNQLFELQTALEDIQREIRTKRKAFSIVGGSQCVI